MSRSDKLLIFTFGIVVITAIVSIQELVQLKDKRAPSERDLSIVRLYRPLPPGLDGVILCSGIVISPTKILTAAHCLTPTDYDTYPPLIEVRTADDKKLGIFVNILDYNVGTDVGVLFGDLSKLPMRGIDVTAAGVNYGMKHHRIQACGYPQGGHFTCTDVADVKNFGFKMTGIGFAYPGMSGGPVIDTDTGNVLGVISAVTGDDPKDDGRIIIAPLVELYRNLGLQEGF